MQAAWSPRIPLARTPGNGEGDGKGVGVGRRVMSEEPLPECTELDESSLTFPRVRKTCRPQLFKRLGAGDLQEMTC